MKEYRVTWEIELTASSAFEAAKAAQDIQRDRTSTANVFKVLGPGGSVDIIDLDAVQLERATVLAALRLLQSTRHLPADIADIATDGGTLEPMTAEEIDALCEAING